MNKLDLFGQASSPQSSIESYLHSCIEYILLTCTSDTKQNIFLLPPPNKALLYIHAVFYTYLHSCIPTVRMEKTFLEVAFSLAGSQSAGVENEQER